MKKTMISVVVGSVFILYASNGISATVRCIVAKITENNITLDCGNRVKNIKVGDGVKVKTTRRAVVEGC